MSGRSGRLFAEITALLEDMHGLAVEGQSPSLSPDEEHVMGRSLIRASHHLGRLLSRLPRSGTQSG